MSVIKKGRIFANGEQLTAEKLNVLVDEASFNSSAAVDNSTTRVNSSGAITVKPQGITSTELENGAVTLAKMESRANNTVIGNTSGSSATPQEVTIYDEDNMASNSDTGLATQQSIKAYVGNQNVVYAGTESAFLPNGLIIKQGRVFSLAGGSSTTVTFAEEFPNDCLNVQATFNSSASVTNSPATSGLSSTEFTLSNSHTAARNIFWLAIGY